MELISQAGWFCNQAPAFLLHAVLYGRAPPSLSISSLENLVSEQGAKKAGPAEATSRNAPPCNAESSNLAGWDLSTPDARKASAAEYRRTQPFKDKRAERRRAKRADTGPPARSAAAQGTPAHLRMAHVNVSETGYTGSLAKEDRSAAKELWDPAVRGIAESKLQPVPYESAHPLIPTSSAFLIKHGSPSAQGPTYFLDEEGRRFAARSFIYKTMGSEWMGRLLQRFSDFVDACKLTNSGEKHSRGYFAQRVLGLGHGTGENSNVSSLRYLPRGPDELFKSSCLTAAPSIKPTMRLFQICSCPRRCKISCQHLLSLFLWQI